MAEASLRPRRGETIELDIESAAYEGVAVARHQGLVVFVRNAVPGDRVRARVRRIKRRFAEAELAEVLTPSPQRVEPVCQYFGICGGCSWQNVDYSEQLRFKREQVEELFTRIGHLGKVRVEPTLGSPLQYFYRNKMEFSFGAQRWLLQEEIESGLPVQRDFALGMHIPRRYDRILDLESCHLQSSVSAQIVNRVRDIARSSGWSAYNSTTREGFLRNLVIRTGQRTGHILVNPVTSRTDPERLQELTRQLVLDFPQITTVVGSVNSSRSPVAAGEETTYHGPGRIEEVLNGLRFRITPTTFFQPNTLQAERLLEVVRNFCGLIGSETIYDLYCGVGAIGLYLSRSCRKVVGIELQERAVEDAGANAERNSVDNCSFVAGDASQALTDTFQNSHGDADIAILDPPRAGLNRRVCEALLQRRIPRLVYVSCNPATQARDLQLLSSGYHLLAIQPVDMFPQTHHIENVTLCEWRQ